MELRSIFCLQAWLWVTVLLALSRCSPLSARTPEKHGLSKSNLDRRQGGFFPVLGAGAVGDGSVQPRLEIRELERNVDQWNVYLLGLRRFQSLDQKDKLSYYQVGGIHGRPYIPWDAVPQGPGDSGGGYCPHHTNIFPTWHRPYLALFEQALYISCRAAIAEFPAGDPKQRYENALRTFRMPYWDWAAPGINANSILPMSMQRQKVDIVGPNGRMTVDNPLFAYTFHPLNQTDFPDPGWGSTPTTLRKPGQLASGAASHNDAVDAALRGNQANMQSRIYGMLSEKHRYEELSNDVTPGDSLESVHDTVHADIGGQGHMSYLAYAAFDPAFVLHHAFVDRIFAIWQALNPTEYVKRERSPWPTFTMPGGTEVDAETPLTPFHRDESGAFWTSSSIRDHTVLGYTYPELINTGSGNDSISTIKRRVNELYGPNASSSSISRRASLRRASQKTSHVAGAPSFSGRRKYAVEIEVDKSTVGESLMIYAFLLSGDTSNAASASNEMGTAAVAWRTHGDFVGVTGFLARGAGMSDSDVASAPAHGAVPLTAVLENRLARGELSELGEEEVGRYLKGRLLWKVSGVDGQEIGVERVKSLKVRVVWVEMEPARGDGSFPKKVGEWKVLSKGGVDGMLL